MSAVIGALGSSSLTLPLASAGAGYLLGKKNGKKKSSSSQTQQQPQINQQPVVNTGTGFLNQ